MSMEILPMAMAMTRAFLVPLELCLLCPDLNPNGEASRVLADITG